MNKHIALLVVAGVAAMSGFASIQTNVWVNTAVGVHAFENTDNWKDGILPVNGTSVTNVFDFSQLASGAVVSNGWQKDFRTTSVVFGTAESTVMETWELKSPVGAPLIV